MIVLGLTGGIGSGKGLAAEFCRRRGAVVLDADVVAREVVRPGSQTLAELAMAFGRQILRPDGSLDRRALAEAVFGRPEAVRRLNELTHPAIVQEIDRRLDGLRRAGEVRVVCLVAPLLVEAGLQDRVDRLLVVVADEEERIRRVMRRDGVGQEEVKRRMAAQMPSEELRRQADWVVDTTQGRAEAWRRLEVIWRELENLAG